ncbi:uncharacterized protein Dana_GF13426, isoform C [Drosophila ananassae]|uniref:Uncharacterized protein, isoform C n=1 Tax=Drosophila ananassae TaxID=7217 RepID=A0A0N8P0D1_DROAN|nr:uncharacterized protein LOC6496268 isoform X6 [Drosophila ananassae]KPU76788.1 uncharacterized protein Dana_GF13426, isoform C [Drosophila ananassae]
MSKKMWNKIFKSKSQKPQPLGKINKRHSRGIYEEYQQLNDLLAGEKAQLNFSQNEKENDHGNGCGNGNGNGNGNINVFEQQPQQSSFNSLQLSEAQQEHHHHHQQQQQQQLSTFSRVRNTFSLKRNKKQPTNAKSTINATTDLDAEEPIRGTDDDPLPPPPPPLTTGLSVPVPEYVPAQSSDLTPCPCCSRTFNVNALRKHIVICEKSSKKRKVFDSSRQRREGTSLSTYVLPKNFGLPNAERNPGVSPPCTSREAAAALAAAAEPVSSPIPVRRKSQTEMVRSTARASLRKTASTLSNNSGDTAVATGAPAPAAVATSAPAAAPPAPRERSLAKRIKGPACDRCPHCDRTFNPKAFDRHVEWCKEKAIQATMKSGNSQETSKAKERLEARKQYRPPNLKTKRSLARDKYSGHHEEVLEAGDMSTPKPNMMSLSMTSSVHSDNNQMVKVRGEPSRSTTQVTQNQVSLYMSHDEDPPSSPPPRERMSHRSKRKQSETCCEIDETMDRLRRNAAGEGRQLATLDCVEAPTLKPVRSRKGGSKRDKLEMGDKEISLPNLPQVTMTFEELNGLIKRKGGTPICNVQMDEQEIASLAAKTSRSSTSLVRQARRRLRTRENPNLELRALEQEPVLTKNVEFASLDSSLVPLHRKQRGQYSPSEDESPRAEIQIKLEATTMRTVCRPKKRSAAAALGNSEPMRALPMPQLKQSLEAINQSIGKVSLPRLELGNERKDDTYDQEEEISDLDFDEELEKDSPRVVVEEPLSEEEEEIAAVVEKPVMTLPPLIKQGSNVSRRLVVLEQDENGTMYIKSAPNGKRRLKRSDSNMSGMTDVSSQHEEKQSRQAEIEKQTRLAEIEKQNRLAEIEKQSRLAEIEKQSRLAELEMQTRLAEMEKQNRLAELETQSRLAELEKRAAAEDQQKREIFNRNSAEDQQKREIFISIETEANAQGRSPISPDSLRHMVGNSQTPIDVLHIENGNEPEHARFSKISDTEDAGEEPGDRPSQLNSNRLVQSSSSCALAPNVQLNNAKNLIQKMQSDFRQLGEEASASMRRTLIANSGRSEEQQQMRDPEPNSQQQQQHQFQQQQMQHQQEKPSSPLTPSPSADSDELSSLDSYTMLSRGAGSKLSTDSAYGSSNSPFSLSRQRSSELQPGTPRSQGLLRPHTANAKLAGNMSDASTQAHTKYGTLKARQRLFSNNGSSVTSNNGNGDGAESSSSGSENSLEVQQKQQQQQHTSNYNYQQQQQHQTQSQPAYKTNTINNNTTVPMTPTTSQHSLLSNTSNTSSMSSSMKMSKFCHECGAKFIVEQAKFCMECGVRRMVL